MNYTRHNAAQHAPNPYTDNYTGFTWNNLHSSSFNCFIENTGHLEFVGAPDFSNNFTAPAFQTRTYYTGMQTGSKKFTLNLVFFELTLRDLNAAFRWLDRNIISDLYFDYEPYWKYSCKLANIGTIEKYVVGHCADSGHNGNQRLRDLYLCKVPVTFETVYRTEALSTYAVYWYSQVSSSIPKAPIELILSYNSDTSPSQVSENLTLVYDIGTIIGVDYYAHVIDLTEVSVGTNVSLTIEGVSYELQEGGSQLLTVSLSDGTLQLVYELSNNLLSINSSSAYFNYDEEEGQLTFTLNYTKSFYSHNCVSYETMVGTNVFITINGIQYPLEEGIGEQNIQYQSGAQLNLKYTLLQNVLSIGSESTYTNNTANAGQLSLTLNYDFNPDAEINSFPYEYQTNINDTQNYFDLNSQFQFVTLNNNYTTDKYYDIIIRNPSAYPTNFKLHLYNVVDGVTAYQVFNNEAMNGEFNSNINYNDIDPYYNITQICHIDLGLESQFPLDLHYNSEDGTVMCCNRLIEQLRGADQNIPCIYKSAMANITIPGAPDTQQPAETMLRIVPSSTSFDNFSFAIEYDIYEYMV